MHYYKLNYEITIDGKVQEGREQIIVLSQTDDYRPHQAEDRIVEEFKRKNPSSKVTAVLEGEPAIISKEEYQATHTRMLEIKSP
jgi:hypothetical protein